MRDAHVAEGAGLAFESGVVVKGHDTASGKTGRIVVNDKGRIAHAASVPDDIIFTSMHDDATAGAAVISATTSPKAGDWGGIFVKEDAALDLSGFTLRYAGEGDGEGGITTQTAATSTIDSALIEYNKGLGIKVDDGDILMKNTTLNGHTNGSGDGAGLRLFDSDATLEGIIFSNNDIDIHADDSSVTCTNCGTPTTTPSDLLE